MINRRLFEKTREMCGARFVGGVSDTIISDFENKMRYDLSEELYKFFKGIWGRGNFRDLHIWY